MITCPLCQFPVDDREACHGCGLTTHCTMVKCPNCQYEFVQHSRIVGFLKRLKGKWFKNFKKGIAR